MKINFDLLRDLLLAVESESTLDKGVLFFDHSERAAKIRSSLGVQSIPPLPPYQKDLELHYSLEEIFLPFRLLRRSKTFTSQHKELFTECLYSWPYSKGSWIY